MYRGPTLCILHGQLDNNYFLLIHELHIILCSGLWFAYLKQVRSCYHIHFDSRYN